MELMSPLLQYGFAGFALILLGVLVWLIRQFIGFGRTNLTVIAANTQAIVALTNTVGEILKLQRAMDDRLKSGRSELPGGERG